MKKQIYSYGMDYYCPHCTKEMYALSVSGILNNGGVCNWCGGELRSGECVLWSTYDGDGMFSFEMDDQHISNVIYYLNSVIEKETCFSDHKKRCLDAINIFKKELEYRGIEMLPYKPYFDKETEDKIFRRTE